MNYTSNQMRLISVAGVGVDLRSIRTSPAYKNRGTLCREDNPSTAIMFIILLLAAVYILFQITKSLLSPLRSIPGPFWARFSNLWYFNRLRKGRFEHENIALHQEYGPIVRLGPNHYSISDATSVKKIYGPGSKFAKSAWYDSWKHPAQWTVFSDRDIKRHCSFPINPGYLIRS